MHSPFTHWYIPYICGAVFFKRVSQLARITNHISQNTVRCTLISMLQMTPLVQNTTYDVNKNSSHTHMKYLAFSLRMNRFFLIYKPIITFEYLDHPLPKSGKRKLIHTCKYFDWSIKIWTQTFNLSAAEPGKLTLNVRGPSYLGLTRSISWLLLPWLLTSPVHQQPWYWLCRIGGFLSYLRKDFNYLRHISVEKWHKI